MVGPYSRNILRSVSFSKLNLNSKVKNNIENNPGKQKITRDLTGNDLREQGLRNPVTKYTSFKSTNLGGPNTESGSNCSFHPSHIGEIKRPKELQEGKVVETKSFSAVGNSFFTSSPGSHCLSKGSDDTSYFGADGGKKQITCSSKISGSSNGISRLNKAQKSKVHEEDIHTSIIAGDESCCMADTESKCTVVLPTEFVQKRIIGSTMLVSSRTSSCEDNRTIHCNCCNGTEHATQHCSIDKVGESSHKHASDWNSREVVKGHNRCTEAVVTLRNRESKNNKTVITGELPAVTVDMISDVPSNFTSPVSRQIDVPLVVERHKDQHSSENLDVHPIKPIEVTNLDQQLQIPFEAPLVPKPAIYNDSATAPLAPKPAIYNDRATVAEATRAETSAIVKPYCALTFPKLEYIWQGSFNVLGTRSVHEVFHGIQAHISNCASYKVFEVATKLPNNIQLDEISYSSSWKVQCQVTTPQEENIALFFFAKNIESYERSYRKLMEKMRRNDTALRGNIDGTELLVFLSNKLSLSSQRWNGMHYLWGMFRAKKRNSITLMGEKKPSLPNLNVNLISDDLSIARMERVHRSTKNSEGILKLNKLPESSTPNSIPGESTDAVDNLHSIASNIEDTICGKIGPSLVWNCSNQDAENLNVSVEHVSSPVCHLSRTTAMPLVVESRLQNATPKSGSKEENVGTCQEELINDCTHREAVDSHALPHINAESSLTTMPSVAGTACSKIDAQMEDNKCSLRIMDNNPKASVLQTDYLSNESNNSRKHSRSCSMERSSQPHVEFSGDTDEMERRKKTYNTFGSSIFYNNLSPQLSPKVKQLHSSICSLQEQGECSSYSEPLLFPSNTATAEQCFFPMDMGLLKSTKSSDADTPQLSTPDLELALGSKSRLTKPAAIPFLSFNEGTEHLEPGSTGDDGGDVSASLSLSLTLS
ncbi:hypothetical protein HPP92_020560 [Vanilla planifolia]|uniref:AIPP2-like SPOC-like domain-containing protein n=1 Tax=Vanilla planifolia TaxID=51239 RepID=A0A835UGD5_VANPL|nr:hypothetical protein HPP92_020560 [Vanilla planifolia]